ncbi:MAG: LON peptidase substrate-binding domain-containing protein [Cytophagales bacterium]|nr:LON peptidase substrate-binding domain-containing protein [Bernardetiaceae bacterium]MDW8204928.1 LON peptidase substrate-binding domain-containing protein [Cytophagales bacterium]
MLPFFPLNIVVYPYEMLNLHIFEPRYRQLIGDCLANNSTFGIPVYLNNAIQPIGTEVRIVELARKYADGTMDIRVEGWRIFSIQDFFQPMPGKLHAGGKVSFLPTEDDSDIVAKARLIAQIDELYQYMKLKHEFSTDMPFLSYKVAHRIGLSLAQQYQVLCLLLESERIDYISDCLAQIIPVVVETERLRELIRMNGHFRRFDPLSF